MIIGLYTNWDDFYFTPSITAHNRQGYFMIAVEFLFITFNIEFET